MTKVFIFLFVFLSPFLSFATITTATSSGNWNSSGTWDNGIPSCGDTIWIDSNVTVTITGHVNLDETSSPACSTKMFLYIEGTLHFNTGQKLYLACGSSAQIDDGGQITKGSGGGNSNVIDVCQTTVWNAGDGNISGPLVVTGNGLPIKLEYFKAIVENDRILLNWKTLSEINNDFFTVERSIDLKNLEEIIKVDGAGNSTGELIYKAYDTSPIKGISYYRLKQTDFNGSFEYSEWVAVRVGDQNDNDIIVIDNISNKELIIEINGQKGGYFDFVLSDASGRIIYKSSIFVDSDNYIERIDKLVLGHKGIAFCFIGNQAVTKSLKVMF